MAACIVHNNMLKALLRAASWSWWTTGEACFYDIRQSSTSARCWDWRLLAQCATTCWRLLCLLCLTLLFIHWTLNAESNELHDLTQCVWVVSKRSAFFVLPAAGVQITTLNGLSNRLNSPASVAQCTLTGWRGCWAQQYGLSLPRSLPELKGVCSKSKSWSLTAKLA